MEIIDYKKHSSLFNKYYCLINNASDLELYYNGVAEFLRYRFTKSLLEKNKEKNNFLNENDKKILEKISKR